jgi:hypothetical protein
MAALTHDPHRRKRALWFLTVNVMALLLAVALFAGVLYGDGLSVIFEPLMLGIYKHKILVVAIATSPLFASLLVGGAYAQRALRRKRAQAAAQEAAEASS